MATKATKLAQLASAITTGAIDNTTVGITTPAAIAGTTGNFTGDLTIADKIVHSSDTNTAIRFPGADTVSVETSGLERMCVDSSGKVGIGTNAPTQVLDVVGTVKSTAVITDTINGTPLNQGILEPDNRIINGAFDFWQRGTSFTASAYGADRWLNGVSGGTVTMSRQAFSVGDTLGNNNPTYFARQTVSGQTLTSNLALIQQRIEGVRSYAGQTITVLGWAKRSSGSGNMAVEMAQTFGTGGSPSADVTGTGQTVTLTGSWAPFAVTFSVPSITGKTLGTSGNDYSNINFWTSAGSDYNARTNSLGLQTIGVDLWGIHIKVGTHTTAATNLYRQPELASELVKCQRYFCKNFNINETPLNGGYLDNRITIGTIYNSTEVQCAEISFPVTMRIPPGITFYNPSFITTAGRWGIYPMLWGATSMVPTIISVSQYRLIAGGSGVTGGTNYNTYIVSGYFTADAEL